MNARKRSKLKSRHPIEPAAVAAKPSPAKLSWQKKFVFSIVPLVLLLAGAEAVCRFMPRPSTDRTLPGLVEPDPDLVWRLPKPGGINPQVNELRMRDAPFNQQADIKILLLGDSVSWADGVGVGEGFPYLLEGLLAAAVPGKSFEVINSAVPGYSTFQQAKYLELYGLDFKPGLIVLQFCLNDVVERYHTLAEYGGENVFLGVDTRDAAEGVYGFLLRHSRAFENFMRFLQSWSRNRQEYDVKQLARTPLSPQLQAAWDQTFQEIDEIRRLAAANDIPLLVVIAPYFFQLEKPGELRQPQDKLLEYARERGIPCVDLLNDLADRVVVGVPGYGLFNDSNHFSKQGHREVAELLVASVVEGLRLGQAAEQEPAPRSE